MTNDDMFWKPYIAVLQPWLDKLRGVDITPCTTCCIVSYRRFLKRKRVFLDLWFDEDGCDLVISKPNDIPEEVKDALFKTWRENHVKK